MVHKASVGGGFVASIAVNGKILREIRDRETGVDNVYIPFGSEYSIRLKNLDHRRAVVSITIDGEDVLGCSQLVLNGNETMDLKGRLDRGGDTARYAFKFIEKTSRIKNYRGDRQDDGIIRIQVQFEAPIPVQRIPILIPRPLEPKIDPWTNPNPWTPTWCGAQPPRGICGQSISGSEIGECSNSILHGQSITNKIVGDGITVDGSDVDQRFDKTYVGQLDTDTLVIILKLLGKTSKNIKVTRALTSRSKPVCKMCGTANQSRSRFCIHCGSRIL